MDDLTSFEDLESIPLEDLVKMSPNTCNTSDEVLNLSLKDQARRSPKPNVLPENVPSPPNFSPTNTSDSPSYSNSSTYSYGEFSSPLSPAPSPDFNVQTSHTYSGITATPHRNPLMIQTSEVSPPSSDLLKEQRLNETSQLKSKPTRPFKAYLRNSLKVPNPPELILDHSDDDYTRFRQMMLGKLSTTQPNGTNKNMRRVSNSSQCEDPSYLEKRRKNNEAAKRSRDARRAKEDEIAIRCAFLEQQNFQLKIKIGALSSELQRCQSLLTRNWPLPAYRTDES